MLYTIWSDENNEMYHKSVSSTNANFDTNHCFKFLSSVVFNGESSVISFSHNSHLIDLFFQSLIHCTTIILEQNSVNNKLNFFLMLLANSKTTMK